MTTRSSGNEASLLADVELRPLSLEGHGDLTPIGLALADHAGGLEIALARAPRRPQQATMRAAWKARHNGRAAPVLLVATYGDSAAVCGPIGEEPPVYLDVDVSQIDRLCRTALAEPTRNAAIRFLLATLPELGESAIPGLRNEGLFATHELAIGVPMIPKWADAQKKSAPLLHQRGRTLLAALGFQVIETQQNHAVLRAGNTKVAVAIFLDRTEPVYMVSTRFGGMTPIQYALAKADEENLDYVVVDHGPALRVYTVASSKGVGRRGRTETFVEVHLDLLPVNKAGYLWLLFSADALGKGGTFAQILDLSHDYASNLGTRLRERIYDEVVPRLAIAIAEARELKKPTAGDLDTTYEMALLVLFRLLFIAYAEDKDLLPYRTNELYKTRSLKTKARELADLRRKLVIESPGDPDSYWRSDDSATLWQEVEKLFQVVDAGKPKEWGVPGYNGGMFSKDESVSPAGALLAKIELPNRDFGPVLSHLLVDEAPEGLGPVDFRSLGVREFGTIYEGLLESELSVAEQNLALDSEGLYVPATGKMRPVVKEGQIYLHNASGARKSTGSYYTKSFAVEHLLDQALEPAVTDHFARLDKLDDRAAADAFFDFRVADIAMGSGHFLVAAVDRIEKRLSSYLARRILPGVLDELERLRQSALQRIAEATGAANGVEIENVQLLRRQIARRCIYGVDINKVAVQLARLSLWIHTFVPGLPLSFLDHNIVHGNSLVGIATMDEAKEMLSAGVAGGLFADLTETYLGPVREQIKKLGQLSDADAGQIEAARKAFAQTKLAVGEAKMVFDILTAARLPEAGLQLTFGDLEKAKPTALREKHRKAADALADLPPFHFPVAFPEVFLRQRPGFDVILGNPPWEEATLEEDDFWSRHIPGFQGLAQHEQESLKKRWRKNRLDLVTQLEKEVAAAQVLRNALVHGPFPGMGTGDPDVYKAFCWRFWHLSAVDGGHIGVVLPRSAWVAKGSSEFRSYLFKAARQVDLTVLINKAGWVFPGVHEQNPVPVLAAIARGVSGGDARVVLRGPYRSLASFVAGVKQPARSFAGAEVLSWTDSASLPILPAEESAEVFSQLRKAPRLDATNVTGWRVRAHAELHATNDKGLLWFSEEAPDGYWAVYKGETFDIWEPDRRIYYAWADPEKLTNHLLKKRDSGRTKSNSVWFEFSDRDAKWFKAEDTLPCHAARLVFRDVTNRTNQRTVIAALVPPKVFITNQAPYMLWMRGDERDQAFLLGVLCSIPLDWYARRFVEMHLNFFVLYPLPIPRPPRDDARWRRVVQIAGRLAAADRRFKKWAEAVEVECGPVKPAEKEDMIAELDAVVAHLYGLSEPQITHIFETFHEGWEYRGRLDAVLRHYRVWAAKAGGR